MMEFAGPVLVFIGSAALCVGLISLFKPILGIRTRKRAVMLMLGSLVAGGVGGGLLPVPPPSQRPKNETSEQPQKNETDKANGSGQLDIPTESAKPTGPTTGAESEARTYAKKVTLTLDVTTLESFMTNSAQASCGSKVV